MKRLFLAGLMFSITAIALESHRPSLVSAQPPGNGGITVEANGSCTISTDPIRCGGQSCQRQAVVTWTVTNNNAQNAIVLVYNLKHEATGFYIDPLVGPANRTDHAVAVASGGNQPLRTRVRQIDIDLVRGTYKYDVAVSFDGGSSFTRCADPQIDIEG